eukprot:scaffold16271_cov118-Skeletonema_dohrnii-CCMP3373.AAC.7
MELSNMDYWMAMSSVAGQSSGDVGLVVGVGENEHVKVNYVEASSTSRQIHAHIHSVRYDMVLECFWRPSQIGPHQVTYDAVVWLIHIL